MLEKKIESKGIKYIIRILENEKTMDIILKRLKKEINILGLKFKIYKTVHKEHKWKPIDPNYMEIIKSTVLDYENEIKNKEKQVKEIDNWNGKLNLKED